MTPIGAEGCTCRIRFYNRPFGYPGVTVLYGPDCPHHRAPEGQVASEAKGEDVLMIGDIAFTRDELDGMPWSHVMPWRPADSDS